MLNVAIIGGSGYTGGELLRLLIGHPFVKITTVTSERSAGRGVAELFPNLKDTRLVFEPFNINRTVKKTDLFFLCLPHKTSQGVVARLYKAGKKVIDLSADYRLKKATVYRKWYQTRHRYPLLLRKAVYGLPEINRNMIKDASIVANPGCYPVSAILGLAPLIMNSGLDPGSIIIDSKSGISGAGRNPALPFMFSEANESVKAYAVTTHRHTPEIEQELSSASKKNINVIFTPHLIPMDRGILSTIYLRMKKPITVSLIQKLYNDFYRSEPFVKVLGNGELPSTKAVKGSNFCNISVFLDRRDNKAQTLIIVSAIDNLIKGASGQAVQNMNIMFGFDETTGLTEISPCP
jgi:N-acetyl-gamma-glutamyl-phosphate reductase